MTTEQIRELRPDGDYVFFLDPQGIGLGLSILCLGFIALRLIKRDAEAMPDDNEDEDLLDLMR